MKKLIALWLVLILCIFNVSDVLAQESSNNINEEIDVTGKYDAVEILAALSTSHNISPRTAIPSNDILNDVLLPTSMGISIPHINPAKVIQTVDVYSLDPAFAEALEEHGIFRSSMSYSEYEALENTWILPSDMIASIKHAYPDLENTDISKWTYGTYKQYSSQADKEVLLESITPTQSAQLVSRNILISDLPYLLKEFHTIENILSQADQDLKNILEIAYSVTYDKLISQSQSVQSDPPSDKYTFVYFPRYNYGNGDYFHNDVLTTTYWQHIQADRALKSQQCLYNSTSTTLYCTNMYGTYSYSQGGAHEGIDFVHPNGTSTPKIYAIFAGTKLATSQSHHLAVYDVNSPDEPKTYSYLHMSSITATSTVSPLDEVGRQGNLGNSTGHHVHFEVHSGNTTSLSSGGDHVLGSLSPYRTPQYIGCYTHYPNDSIPWYYNISSHWQVCPDCGEVCLEAPHSFSNGVCLNCGCIEAM